MNWLVPLPIVLPLAGAAVSILVGRSRVAQRNLFLLLTGRHPVFLLSSRVEG